jgi:hypothetical protein
MHQTYQQALCSGVYPSSSVAWILALQSSIRYLEMLICPLLKQIKRNEQMIKSMWSIMAHTPQSTTHARFKQSSEHFPRRGVPQHMSHTLLSTPYTMAWPQKGKTVVSLYIYTISGALDLLASHSTIIFLHVALWAWQKLFTHASVIL